MRNLVETGADIELEDRNGHTPIHEAFQALETNSNRMSWYERKAESSAQDSEFVHQRGRRVGGSLTNGLTMLSMTEK